MARLVHSIFASRFIFAKAIKLMRLYKEHAVIDRTTANLIMRELYLREASLAPGAASLWSRPE